MGERKMNKVARKLRDENNELELGLSKEANDVMTDIVVYIRSANISDLNQEIVRRDIDEMLLEGERRGQSVAEVIGDDYKAFCDSVICEVPQLTPLQRFATLVLDALLGIIIMLAIWTVFAPLRQLSSGGAWYIVTVRTSDLIEGIAIIAAAFFIVGYICKNSFKPKKAVFAVGIIAIVAACFAAFVLLPNAVLLNMHIGISVLIIAVLLAVYFVIDKRC